MLMLLLISRDVGWKMKENTASSGNFRPVAAAERCGGREKHFYSGGLVQVTGKYSHVKRVAGIDCKKSSERLKKGDQPSTMNLHDARDIPVTSCSGRDCNRISVGKRVHNAKHKEKCCLPKTPSPVPEPEGFFFLIRIEPHFLAGKCERSRRVACYRDVDCTALPNYV